MILKMSVICLGSQFSSASFVLFKTHKARTRNCHMSRVTNLIDTKATTSKLQIMDHAKC